MNQNENPLGPSPRAIAAATAALGSAHLYPDGSAPLLRTRLSSQWELPEDWFLIANGSDEVFRLLAETYLDAGDAVIVPAPSFAGYALVAQLMGARVTEEPLADHTMNLHAMAASAADRKARMVFLCRPNSPTGAAFTQAVFEASLPEFPTDTLVILDEAYVDFDDSGFTSRGLLDRFPNLIVTRTFSKLYGMAALRLGYGVMRPEILAQLRRVRDPFSVNLAAMAGGLSALDDVDHIEASRALVREGKTYLYALFERLQLDYVPTYANFILFQVTQPAVQVYEALLRRGVLIRPCTSFGLPNSLRVTIGTSEQNREFGRALEDVLRSERD